jgi:5-methylcytosine-specific restriction endonuclease McrA
MANEDVYHSHRWRKVRRFVLERDGYRCQLRCSPKCRLIADAVDHVERPEDAPGRAFDPTNLRAACSSCNTSRRNSELALRAKGVRYAGRRAW